MVTNANFPVKFHRVAGVYLLTVVVIAAICTIRLEPARAATAAIIMYLVGMLDFAVMFWSMRKALKEKPEKSLKIMRDGMGIRFLAALLFTVAAIKLDYMPWAVLLGLLVIHVVVLIDSVLMSIKFKK